MRPHAADVHRLLVHPDLPVGGDGNEDVALVLRAGGFRLRTLHLDAGLTNEGAGDDEENQHDEDHVEHRCEVDAGIFVLLVVTTHSHVGRSQS